MAAAGVTAAASEEAAAATSQPALPADRCCKIRCLSGFALAADLISALRTAHATAPLGKYYGQGWIRTSEGVKPADLQSAPFGHFGTYPFLARGISYILAPHSLQLASAFAAVDSTNVSVTFRHGASARPFLVRPVSGPDFLFRGAVRVRATRFCQRSSERVCPGKIIRRKANGRNRGK